MSDSERVPWSLRRRLLHSTIGPLAACAGWAMHLSLECFARVRRRDADVRQYAALRRTVRLYWRAQVLDRKGESGPALHLAREAWSTLREGDPKKTFPEMGFIATNLLDRLARENGEREGALKELTELLTVLRQVQKEPDRDSAALGELVGWLERRLG